MFRECNFSQLLLKEGKNELTVIISNCIAKRFEFCKIALLLTGESQPT